MANLAWLFLLCMDRPSSNATTRLPKEPYRTSVSPCPLPAWPAPARAAYGRAGQGAVWPGQLAFRSELVGDTGCKGVGLEFDVAEVVERTVAEVIVAIFEAANPVVGEGVFPAKSDGPTSKTVIRVQATPSKMSNSADASGKGYTASAENQDAVQRIAHAAPQRSQIVGADIHVEAIDVKRFVVPDPIDVAFNTEHPCA